MIDQFESTARLKPDRVFFTFVDSAGRERAYTYRQTRLVASTLAMKLHATGVRSGGRPPRRGRGSRARAVGRGPVVEGDRGRLLPPGLHCPDLQRRLGKPAEPFRRLGHHLGDEGVGVLQILLPARLGVRIFELRPGLDVLEELLERPLEADLRLNRLHLAVDPGHLVQPDLVDPVGGEVGGGLGAKPRGIIFTPAGKAPRAAVSSRLRLDRIESRQHLPHRPPERA